MQQEKPLKHRVFPEGYDTRRNRGISEAQRLARENLFLEARQRRQSEDSAAIASVLEAINVPDAQSGSAYLDRIFPAFENLSPAQQRLIVEVMDPARLKAPGRLDWADEHLSIQVVNTIKPTWSSRLTELAGLFFYGSHDAEDYAKYFSKLAKRHPANKVLYPGSGFDRTVSGAFGTDHVVHMSLEDHYFQNKHVDHDFDSNQPDIDVTGDIRAMPFRSEAFDLTVLKHLPPGALLANDGLGLDEVIRTLRPGGKVFYASNVLSSERDELILPTIRKKLKQIDEYRWIEVFQKPV